MPSSFTVCSGKPARFSKAVVEIEEIWPNDSRGALLVKGVSLCFADDAFVLFRTVLTAVGQLAVRLFSGTKHTHHLVSVLPGVRFPLVVTLVAAVVSATARWQHPVCDVHEMLTFVGHLIDQHVHFTQFPQSFTHSFVVFYVSVLELKRWDFLSGSGRLTLGFRLC